MNGARSALSFLTAGQFVRTKDGPSVLHWAKKQWLRRACSRQLMPQPFQGTQGSSRPCNTSGGEGQGYLQPRRAPATPAVVVRHGGGMWHTPSHPQERGACSGTLRRSLRPAPRPGTEAAAVLSCQWLSQPPSHSSAFPSAPSVKPSMEQVMDFRVPECGKQPSTSKSSPF